METPPAAHSMGEGASTLNSTARSSTSRPSAGTGRDDFSLAVSEAPEPQRRRWKVWVALAGATAALEAGCYFLSGDTCGVEELGLGAAAELRLLTREEVFFEWQPLLVVGPWASAVLFACFVDHKGRFDAKCPVHVWGRRFAAMSVVNVYPRLLAIPFWCAEDEGVRYGGQAILNYSFLSWMGMQVIAVWLVVLRLDALCQMDVARFCRRLIVAMLALAFAISVGYFVRVFHSSPSDEQWTSPAMTALKTTALLGFLSILTAAAWGMLRAASAAEHAPAWARGRGAAAWEDASLSHHMGGDASQQTTASRLRPAIRWTRTTAVVTMASGALSVAYVSVWLFQSVVNAMGLGWLQVADHVVNCAQMAFLSGLVGPDLQRSSENLTRVGRHSGFALQEAKRIAFSGAVSVGSGRCIASFPGMHAELWARVTGLRSRQASVACVFLTDSSAGLGEHAADPENPQHACYCKSIYPPFPANAYLRTVRRPSALADAKEYRRQLAFEKADAEAMGVHLLVESDYPSFLRGWAERRALRTAGQLCDKNGARAPWGCMWFEKWVKNVEKAAALGQELLVFYDEGKVGAGKLPWEHLSDPERVMLASGCSGLGASQRVEVSFLDRKGYSYTELDVSAFEREFPQS